MKIYILLVLVFKEQLGFKYHSLIANRGTTNLVGQSKYIKFWNEHNHSETFLLRQRTSCSSHRTSAAWAPARSTRGTAGSHATWAARSRSWRNASSSEWSRDTQLLQKKRVASNLGDVLLPNQTDDNCWPELNYDSLRKNLLTSSDGNSKIYCNNHRTTWRRKTQCSFKMNAGSKKVAYRRGKGTMFVPCFFAMPSVICVICLNRITIYHTLVSYSSEADKLHGCCLQTVANAWETILPDVMRWKTILHVWLRNSDKS